MPTLEKYISILKTNIFKVFDDTTFPGSEKILHIECYDDDSDVLEFYSLEEWQSIPDNVIAYNNGSLSFFSPEAYQFYLPRFLIFALDNYDSGEIVIDSTIYSLWPTMGDDVDVEDVKGFLASHGDKIESQGREAMENIVSHFETQDDDDLIEFTISKYKYLTSEQKKVIFSFLKFINDHLLEYFDEVAVKSALVYWQKDINKTKDNEAAR